MIAQYLGNATFGTELAGGIVGNLHRDNLARAHQTFFPGRDKYLLGEAAIVGNDKADAAVFLVTAHHRFVLALQHFHHLAFQTAAAVFPGDLHQHLVAVEHEVHLPCAEVDVIALPQRHGKAVTVAVTLHTAVQQVHLIHQAVSAATIDHQLAVALHGPQAFLQGLPLLRFSEA